MTPAKHLPTRNDELQERLDAVRAELQLAREEKEADLLDAAVEGRPVNALLAPRVAKLEAEQTELSAALIRAVRAKTEREKRMAAEDARIAERAAARAKKIEEFRESTAPLVRKMGQQSRAFRDTVVEFFKQMELAQIDGDCDIAGLIIPVVDQQNIGAELSIRGARLTMLNAAIEWAKQSWRDPAVYNGGR